ncbi:MAG: ATP-binding protein [Phycisphaerales bacterium]
MPQSEPGKSSKRFSTHRILSGMRIRKKLIVLHTAFSLGLGLVLLIAIRPAMSKVIFGAEYDQSQRLVEVLLAMPDGVPPTLDDATPEARVDTGADATAGIPEHILTQARANPAGSIPVPPDAYAAGVIRYLVAEDSFLLVRSRSERARETIRLVYMLVIAILLLGYGLVAAALELFVLPQHVYRPIRAMLSADRAVSEGDRESEIIPADEIPADELGSIMRSRNQAITALRRNEFELARALDRLEHTAADLHKKNHLLETARKNLEGADRLASLGMMSAGIAHELNTPLAVVKGLVDKLKRNHSLSDTETALLSRVVGRLETLSEGLLDFARVRPPMSVEADVHTLVSEACTLVMLDRHAQIRKRELGLFNHIEPGTLISCNPDRLVQVFVNLIRNAVDALVESSAPRPLVELRLDHESRDGTPWVVIRIIDNGPGIDSDLIDRLFEPFVSSRLDAQGTGLGLAVANGIIREHGGVLTATNRSTEDGTTGAVFEVMIPVKPAEDPRAEPG